MMKRLYRGFAAILTLALIVTLLSGCGGGTPAGSSPEGSGEITGERTEDGAAQNDVITVPSFSEGEFPGLDGSTATLPLGRLLYRMSTGATELDAAEEIIFTKTTSSYIRLMDGETDLVIAYEAGETAKDDERYNELEIKPVGMDALVFLCNDANPVESLSTEQIQGIYSGWYTNWQEVGGEDKPIIAFQRPEDSGSQTLMEKLMMKDVAMTDAPSELKPGEMGELIEAVASYDNSSNAIGYSVYYYARNMYRIPGVRLMGVDGVMPENDTIRSGQYSYVNPFYAAVRKSAPDNSPERVLFDWLTGQDGQSMVNALGYVGVDDSNLILPKEYETSPVQIDPVDKLLVLDASIYNGNAGVIVFDEYLKPSKYIQDIRLSDGGSFVLARNNLIIANTPAYTDEYMQEDEPLINVPNTGLYDLDKETWVVPPEYGYSALRLSDPDELRYYFYTYDYTKEDVPLTAFEACDEYGRHVDEYLDEEELDQSSIDPDSYEIDYVDDNTKETIFRDRVLLRRTFQYDEDDVYDSEFNELFLDGELTDTADYFSNMYPMDGVSERRDQIPYGYISITMSDIKDREEYTSQNDRYILINDRGDMVYRIRLAESEWVVMSTDEYILVADSNDLYKIIDPEGNIITTWRYSTYGETEWM